MVVWICKHHFHIHHEGLIKLTLADKMVLQMTYVDQVHRTDKMGPVHIPAGGPNDDTPNRSRGSVADMRVRL